MADTQEFNTILCYKTAMSLYKNWFSDGIISRSDLCELSGALCEKYGLSKNSIFLDNDLLCAEIRANMHEMKKLEGSQ